MPTYFLKKKGNLIMASITKFKLLTILFFLTIQIFCSNIYATILYEKNEIVITEFDIDFYMKYYEDLFGEKIDKNKALKNIILIKRIIRKLENNNKNTISLIDQEIKNQLGLSSNLNKDFLDFNRYILIKNQYLNEYYNNSLNLDDFTNIKEVLKSSIIGLSSNDCLTISKTIKISELNEFETILYKKIKENNQDQNLIINGQNFKLCFDGNINNKIEAALIKLLEKKIKKDFDKFIYEK